MGFLSMVNLGVCMAQLGIAKVTGVVNSWFVALLQVDVGELLGNGGAATESSGALYQVDQKVQELGGGAFHVVRNLVIYVAGVAILLTGGALALHARNAQKREEDKSAIGWTIAAAVLIFAALSILIFAQKIGENLFN